MLWQVKNTPIKFIGSIHALQQASQIQPYIHKAYSEAKKLVLEADPKALPSTYGRTGKDNSLRDSLGDELYGQWRRNFNPDAPTDFKLWRAGTLLSSIFMGNAGFSDQFGVEATLMPQAQSDCLEIDFLENGPQVEACFDSIPYECQRTMLVKSLDHTSVVKSVRKLVDGWIARDMNRLEKYAKKEFIAIPDFQRALLINRNQTWLPKLLDLVAGEQPTTICAGILHFVGDQSLLQLLEARGISLKRVH